MQGMRAVRVLLPEKMPESLGAVQLLGAASRGSGKYREMQRVRDLLHNLPRIRGNGGLKASDTQHYARWLTNRNVRLAQTAGHSKVKIFE
jgi:hypothetical protein